MNVSMFINGSVGCLNSQKNEKAKDTFGSVGSGELSSELVEKLDSKNIMGKDGKNVTIISLQIQDLL